MDVVIFEENKGSERWISVKFYWKKCENVLEIFPDTQDKCHDGGYTHHVYYVVDCQL
jgi:hypothetical protein